MRTLSIVSWLALTVLLGSTAQAQDKDGWSGSINLNANLSVSTQDTQSTFIDARAKQRLKAGSQFDFSALYINSRQTSGDPKTFNTTEDRWQLLGRYDTPSNGRRYGFITQSIERNAIVNLGQRRVTSAGLGLTFVRTEEVRKSGRVEKPGDAEWRVNAGVSYLQEDYLNDLGSRHQYGLQFSSNFTKVFHRGIEISHYISFVPAFEDLSEFYLFSNLSLAFPLNRRTRLAVNYIFDYTTTPAPETRKDNYKYALTLGYKF